MVNSNGPEGITGKSTTPSPRAGRRSLGFGPAGGPPSQLSFLLRPILDPWTRGLWHAGQRGGGGRGETSPQERPWVHISNQLFGVGMEVTHSQMLMDARHWSRHLVGIHPLLAGEELVRGGWMSAWCENQGKKPSPTPLFLTAY